jgi:hypothetical protein
MGTGSFLGGKPAGGVVLTTHPNLAPRLRREWRYTSTPPLVLRGLFKGKLYLLLVKVLKKYV